MFPTITDLDTLDSGKALLIEIEMIKSMQLYKLIVTFNFITDEGTTTNMSTAFNVWTLR